MTEPAPESYPNAAAEPATARGLRRFARVTALFTALALLLLPVAVGPFVVAAHQSTTLLRTGVRVPGEVTQAWRGGKWHFVRVAYRVARDVHEQTVVVSSGHGYRRGEHVTVVADPVDPLHMRTLAESNESRGWTLAGVVFSSLEALLLITAAMLVPRYWSMRRRCEQNRWVRAEAGPLRTWRRLRGVTVLGAGADAVVDECVGPLLEGPAWVLGDTCAGRPAILRIHKWGSTGGPLQVSSFNTWKPKRLRDSQSVGR